ncbi:MAG: hypothetical protein CMM45_11400 [Rhodospirillaceae bacterium]|nr:hypothetical protein [Rhodospirillaceae bacterium]
MSEHIRHFLTFGCKFSACGFLFISERDAITDLHRHYVYTNHLVIGFSSQPAIGKSNKYPSELLLRFKASFDWIDLLYSRNRAYSTPAKIA